VTARGSRAVAREDLVDRDLFPPAFLRLLSVVPAAIRRLRAGSVAGTHVVPGTGGHFLFRGHREYRPGDDLRRVDWGVLARHERTVVREFDEEREVRTEVWLDGSASVGPLGGRGAIARAAAICCAVGLAEGGRVRLSVAREGEVSTLAEVEGNASLPSCLGALSEDRPAGRARLERALATLGGRLPRHARWLFLSDLLTRADPGVLHHLAGRGIRGALLHLRTPALTAPPLGSRWEARDVETGEVRAVRWSEALAARVAARAADHAERWRHHAVQTGLAYLPFAPETPAEDVLRRVALDVP
jgi:uncharacterized protein (DUF58 family)